MRGKRRGFAAPCEDGLQDPQRQHAPAAVADLGGLRVGAKRRPPRIPTCLSMAIGHRHFSFLLLGKHESDLLVHVVGEVLMELLAGA